MISSIVNIFLQKMFKTKHLFIRLFAEFFSIFVTVSLIYYASEALSIKGSEQHSLFEFLLIGEISLVLGISFSERWLSTFVDLKNQHFYHTLLGVGLSPWRFSFSKTLADMFFPLLRVIIILIVGAILKNISLSFFTIFQFLLLQVFAIIIYFLFALIAALLYLKFNRGFSLFYAIQSVSVIIAGAYFPLDVLPHGVKSLALVLPQTNILLISRAVFSGKGAGFAEWGALVSWGLILFLIWYTTDKFIIKNLKENSRYF